jgi:hypothetical protein
MDYSLLLGIHYTDREHDPVQAYLTQSSSPTELENQDQLAQRLAAITAIRRQSHYGLQNQQNVITTKSATEFFMDSTLPESITPKNKKLGDKNSKELSIFNSDSGGIRGVDLEGNEANLIYYMGIIDILQQYNAKKRIETTYKSMLVDEVRKKSQHFYKLMHFL